MTLRDRLDVLEASLGEESGETVTQRWLREVLGPDHTPNTPEDDAFCAGVFAALEAYAAERAAR